MKHYTYVIDEELFVCQANSQVGKENISWDTFDFLEDFGIRCQQLMEYLQN